jgi:hypothetical protein
MTGSQKHFCVVKRDGSKTRTTLNIPEQLRLSGKNPDLSALITSLINTAREPCTTKHPSLFGKVIRSKKNKT